MYFKLIVIVLGGMLGWSGIQELRVSQGTSADPVSLSLTDLENGNATVTNPHIELGEHFASYWDCIYEYEQSKYASGEAGPDAKVNYVYYPVVSAENPYVRDVAAFLTKYRGSDAVPPENEIPHLSQLSVLVKSKDFATIGAIPDGMSKQDRVQGLVVNKIESLSQEEIDLIRQGFPGFDPEHVILLEKDRKPSPMIKSLGMLTGGGVILLAGLAWVVTGFRQQ